MLTSDLVLARVRKGILRPSFLDLSEAELARCAVLLETWTAHQGARREELDEMLQGLEGDGTDFAVWRGLSKLIADGSEFEIASALDPSEVRARVFEAAAGSIPRNETERNNILAAVAKTLGVEIHHVEAGLYADLSARQVLKSVPKWSADLLLNRYNVALAQGVLYRATELTIRLTDKRAARIRQVFHMLKFFGLMHRVEKDGKSWILTVDGPASLVSQSRKYGLNLATFLPVVFQCDSWRLNATVEWQPRRPVVFELSSTEVELKSTYRMKGNWRSDEETMLLSRFVEGVDGWHLKAEATILELDKGEVLVADYLMMSPDQNEVVVDVVGFWREGYLARRLEYLENLKTPVVLVVAERMKTHGQAIQEMNIPVVYFKGVIRPDILIQAAERALATVRP